VENGAYECAITCSADSPLLLVRSSKEAVFFDVKGKHLDKFINNPLLIFTNLELTDRINLIIDSHIGLKTIKKLIRNVNNDSGFKITSPVTREDIGSFISMGKSASDIKASDFALSEIFFGEKKLLGLPALWLAVVYFFLEKNGRYNQTEEDIAFMRAFKAGLIDRLKSTRSRITLSGDSNIKPFIECPLDIALWYCCVYSPSDLNTEYPNQLRSIGTRYHLKLLDLLGYHYDKAQTNCQLTHYQIFAVMMREEKENSVNLRNWLRCLYQNSMRLKDGSIILLDGKPALDRKLFRVKIEIVDLNTPKKQDDYLRELPVQRSAHQKNQPLN
jgi:hypothetical protein